MRSNVPMKRASRYIYTKYYLRRSFCIIRYCLSLVSPQASSTPLLVKFRMKRFTLPSDFPVASRACVFDIHSNSSNKANMLFRKDFSETVKAPLKFFNFSATSFGNFSETSFGNFPATFRQHYSATFRQLHSATFRLR